MMSLIVLIAVSLGLNVTLVRQVQAQAFARPPVERAEQLPARTYAVPSSADGFWVDGAPWRSLYAAVLADVRNDLATHNILNAGLRGQLLFRAATLEMITGNHDAALATIDSQLTDKTKESDRAFVPLIPRALIAAHRTTPDRAREALRSTLVGAITRHPFADLQGRLQLYRVFLMTQRDSARFVAGVTEQLSAARNGRLSGAEVGRLIDTRYSLDELKYRTDIVAVFTDVLRANLRVSDYWTKRDHVLSRDATLAPVTIAVWDAGIDTGLFPGRLHVNAGEVSGNGIDDDRNGFVDDVHGAGFEYDGQRTTTLLPRSTLSEAQTELAVQWINGQSDLARLEDDSPAAHAYVRFFQLPAQELNNIRRSVTQLVVWYGHGTQVANIALRDNPAARLLTLISREWRQTNDSTFADLERAQRVARSYIENAAYLRAQRARVANLSWGFAERDFEGELRRLKPSMTASERTALARQLFAIHGEGITAAIKNSPDILFVVTAGNENVDVRETRRLPATLELSNVLTVGSVDAEGNEASFTSFGKVDVYANGTDRPALFPGGKQGLVSAGSLAAPDVVNLAGKLWALYPRATVGEIRHAILKGADERDAASGRKIRILNPKRSLEVLAASAGTER